jgi:lipid-A-disaccharide synthase
MLGAAHMLQQRDARLQFAVPLAAEALRADVERGVRASGLRAVAVYPHESYAVLSRARVVLQCSGTATLEAGLLGLPAVIVYRCRPVEYWLGRHVLVDAPYLGMVNILLDEGVQPELMQEDVTAERLAVEAWSLLTDDTRRRAIQRRLAELPAALGTPGAFGRATDALLELLPRDELDVAPRAANLGA